MHHRARLRVQADARFPGATVHLDAPVYFGPRVAGALQLLVEVALGSEVAPVVEGFANLQLAAKMLVERVARRHIGEAVHVDFRDVRARPFVDDEANVDGLRGIGRALPRRHLGGDGTSREEAASPIERFDSLAVDLDREGIEIVPAQAEPGRSLHGESSRQISDVDRFGAVEAYVADPRSAVGTLRRATADKEQASAECPAAAAMRRGRARAHPRRESKSDAVAPNDRDAPGVRDRGRRSAQRGTRGRH